MSYYDRKPIKLADGREMFKNPQDEANEREVAALIEERWDCKARSLGHFSAFDWFFVKHEMLQGIGELKCSLKRNASNSKWAFLNVRKWTALNLASNGLGVPAFFFIKFKDKVLWTNINSIDATNVEIGGCKRIVKSRNDIEPIIKVPLSTLIEF